MSSETHFSEHEIREIFERAAAEQARARVREAAGGLSLSEVLHAGEQAGLSRAFVARAAQAVALGEPERRRKGYGPLPVSVSHTARLAEPPSDERWEALVLDARRTFEARGETERLGQIREWRNGNLCLTLEPFGEGSRLHLRTRRDDAAVGGMAIGALFVLVALVLVLLSLISGAPPDPGVWKPALVVLVLGSALSGGTLVRQRTWAATRAAQMNALAERALAPPAQLLMQPDSAREAGRWAERSPFASAGTGELARAAHFDAGLQESAGAPSPVRRAHA